VHDGTGDHRPELKDAHDDRQWPDPEQREGALAVAYDTTGEAPTPMPVTVRPTTVRRSDAVVRSTATSRRAAMGAMRPARRVVAQFELSHYRTQQGDHAGEVAVGPSRSQGRCGVGR